MFYFGKTSSIVLFGLSMLFSLKFIFPYRMLNPPRGMMKVRGRSLSVLSPTSIEYLNVPFEEKDEVKALGAKFDVDKKKWYVPVGRDTTPFQKWVKVYLNVPFAEKEEAKKLGAMWDPDTQKWYVRGGIASLFEKWRVSSEIETNTSLPPPRPSSKLKKTGKSLAQSIPVTIMDIDTTGLPIRTKGDVYDRFTALASYNPSRIIQISYITSDLSDPKAILRKNLMIKSDGFPIENTEFHGITLEKSQSEGIPFQNAMKQFFADISDSKYLLFHNAEFCFNILRSELYRYGLFNELEKLQSIKLICIMERSKLVMGLLDIANKPKPPSLKELIRLTIKEELPKQHSSDMDVEYILRIVQNWIETDKINITTLIQN